MRKVLLALAVVIAAVLATTGGGSSARADGQGADWLVAGTAMLAPPPPYAVPMLHVNAQSDFLGANPRGHFWIRYPNGGGEFGGPVVCLNVAVHAAALYGQIEKIRTPRSGFTLGQYVPIRLIDKGSPGTLDMANFDLSTPAAPNTSTCAQDPFSVPISQGDYVVHDKPVTDLADQLGLDQFIQQIESAANDPYG